MSTIKTEDEQVEQLDSKTVQEKRRRISQERTQPQSTSDVLQEPYRRPSRRAAVEAVKKIFHTSHNYNPDSGDPTPSQGAITKRQLYRLVKEHRVCSDLYMDCHEEELSDVQKAFLKEAQDHYLTTMKNIRDLQACNVRITYLGYGEEPSH